MSIPTKRGVGMAAGAVLLFLIGTNIQSGWLFVLASLLLGGAFAGWALAPSMVRGVRVERRAPDEVHAGDDVAVDIVVSNPSRRTMLSLVVDDAHISPVRIFIPRLGRGETLIASTVRRAARRGIVDAHPVRVSSRAPFGSGVARRRIEAPGRTVVFPRLVPIHALSVLAASAKPLQTSVAHARKGAGHDFIGIREYQPGDPMRSIHWPSTARHGALMVREFEQELPRRIGIVIDASADSSGDETALDLCCSAAGSIAAHSAVLAQPVAMTASVGPHLETEADADHVSNLTWLAALQPTGELTAAETARRAAHELGRIDTLILCIPTWNKTDPGELIDAIGNFEGIQVAAILVEAHSFERTRSTPGATEAHADALAAALASSGVTVARIGAGGDLEATLAVLA